MSTFKVLVGPDKTQFDAVFVDNTTWVIYTASEHLGAKVDNKLHNGTLDINGQEIKCQVVNDNDFVPWASLYPGTKPLVDRITIDGKLYDWFSLPDNSNPLLSYRVVAEINGKVINNSFQFPLTAKDSKGNWQTITCIMDSGAFEITLNSLSMKLLNPPNDGKIEIGGVGGNSQAYMSELTFKIADQVFTASCVVDEENIPNLFGFKWFQVKGYALLLDPLQAKLLVLEGPQITVESVSWNKTELALNEQAIWTANISIDGKPAPDNINLEIQVTNDNTYPKTGVLTTNSALSLTYSRSTAGTITIAAFDSAGKATAATATWK